MDSKRKASVGNGSATQEVDERNAKRMRLGEQIAKNGETVESTTELGMVFLEQIRRTADKSGRKVAGYFESLPPRETNAEYYQKTKMPISLSMVEQKLNDHEFSNLSELESYFKRMVSNAKEFYPRNSANFEDAERVRKALSNFMTKTNPAYHNGSGYSAVATPIPADEPSSRPAAATPTPAAHGSTRLRLSSSRSKLFKEEKPVNKEDEADADDASEEKEEPASRRTSIILRRGTARQPSSRTSETPAISTPISRGAAKPKATDVYEKLPYKGLSFQEAQEKITEELLRNRDEFEDFVQLPPRSLKDYYQHIKQPMSITSIRKQTRGEHGRKDPSFVSDFKSWASFEEAISLLWENAYFYNDDDSEIFQVAKQLEAFTKAEIKKAKAVVTEPVQTKIKLKVSSDQPPPSGKKITIHVAGRGGSTDSPAPATGQSNISKESEQPTPSGTPRPAAVTAVAPVMDRVRSTTGSAVSPAPSSLNGIKGEDTVRNSPVPTPASQVNGSAPAAPAQPAAAATSAAAAAAPAATNANNARFEPTFQQASPPQPPKPTYEARYRAAGKNAADALIKNVKIQTYPHGSTDKGFTYNMLPFDRETNPSVTIQVPANHLRVQITPTVASILTEQQRQYRLFVVINRHVLSAQEPSQGQLLPPNTSVFDAQLQSGIVNAIEVHVAAALPKGEQTATGDNYELEVFTVLANVFRN